MKRAWMVMWVLVTACATVGKSFDTTHVNDIQKGRDDKARIREWFGEPHQTSALPGPCVERWQWVHAHSVAGAKATTESLVVDFDAQGKVCDNAFVSQ